METLNEHSASLREDPSTLELLAEIGDTMMKLSTVFMIWAVNEGKENPQLERELRGHSKKMSQWLQAMDQEKLVRKLVPKLEGLLGTLIDARDPIEAAVGEYVGNMFVQKAEHWVQRAKEIAEQEVKIASYRNN